MTRSSAGSYGLLRRVGPAEPVVVFTEYRDTLRQLAVARPDALQLHGGLTAAERADVQCRFNTGGGLLLATDAAAHGLNLQHRCRLLVNFELPWNPARLEQRIGRVDRIGQRRVVHAISLVARDTAEDLVIANLAKRLARVAATLGERDRLGTLLSDARAAQCAVGGVPLDLERTPESTQAVPLRLPPDESRLLERIARQMAGPAYVAARTIPIARIRASAHLAEGAVCVMRYSAQTRDRETIAERVEMLHLRLPRVTKPATQSNARALAIEIRRRLCWAGSIPPSVSAWYQEVEATHQQALTLRIVRETAMDARRVPGSAVQPGLFDLRALRQAEAFERSHDARQEEHRRRVTALERRRDLSLDAEPAAVLIVWR